MFNEKDSERVARKSFRDVTGYGPEADAMIKSGVMAGIIFWEENPTLKPSLMEEENPLVFPPKQIPNEDMEKILAIISPKLRGGSGSMYSQACSIFAYYAKNGVEALLGKLKD